MGLDMYLKGKRYISGYGDDAWEAKAVQRLLDLPAEPRYIEVEAGYWCKANHIHAWFVRTVQDGKDDCGTYYVGREDLNMLYTLCCLILKKKEEGAEGLLAFCTENMPTKSGFFFGGTEYDEYYFSDIEATVQMLHPLLHDEAWKSYSFEYHSSW